VHELSEEQIANFLEEASRLAFENARSGAGGPFGALIVREGQVLGRGVNRVVALSDPTAHAEIQAIREAGQRLGTFDLSGALLFTSCEPCPMCLGAACWARIKAIYYALSAEEAEAIGFADRWIYQELARPKEERALPLFQRFSPWAKKAFALWASSTSKVPY
jgi:guanine deaminase